MSLSEDTESKGVRKNGGGRETRIEKGMNEKVMKEKGMNERVTKEKE